MPLFCSTFLLLKQLTYWSHKIQTENKNKNKNSYKQPHSTTWQACLNRTALANLWKEGQAGLSGQGIPPEQRANGREGSPKGPWGQPNLTQNKEPEKPSPSEHGKQWTATATPLIMEWCDVNVQLHSEPSVATILKQLLRFKNDASYPLGLSVLP